MRAENGQPMPKSSLRNILGPWAAAALVAMSLAPLSSSAAAADVPWIDGMSRSSDAGRCAPDGERMEAPAFGTYGHPLFFPHNRCWAEFSLDRSLIAGAPFGLIISSLKDHEDDHHDTRECVQWDVVIVGVVRAKSLKHCEAPEREDGSHLSHALLPVLIDGVDPNVPDRRLTIRITSRIVEGPAWANARIAAIGLHLGQVCGTVAAAKELAAPTFDAKRAPGINAPGTVAFEAKPGDGQRQIQVWSFGDGQTGLGRVAQHTYLVPGTYSAQVVSVQDFADQNLHECRSLVLAPDARASPAKAVRSH